MDIVVLSQASPKNDETFAEHNLRLFTEAAKLAGHPVTYVPVDWGDVSPEDALCYVPTTVEFRPAVFLGYINENEYYRRLHKALLGKGVVLINDPMSSARAMEFEQFYPLIKDLTPRSVVVESKDALPAVAEEFGWPLFVKGGIKSDKEGGWSACVVDNLDDLYARWEWCAKRPITARNKMIVREVANLRKSGKIVGGFPESREYRVFLYEWRTIGLGYYWGAEDPFGPLGEDEARVRKLAELAAQRVECPLMAVDVGQLEDGSWIVVETGDLQYSGVSQMPHLVFWNELRERVRA